MHNALEFGKFINIYCVWYVWTRQVYLYSNHMHTDVYVYMYQSYGVDCLLCRSAMFYYSALVFGTQRFPFAHQLAENKGQCRQQMFSCSGFCGKGLAHPLRCSCDEICLYIGDCCFDFVYFCKGGYDLDGALTHQRKMMNSFRNKIICSGQYVLSNMGMMYQHIHIPMIAKCPSNTTKRLLALCEDYERYTLPALPEMPVIHNGIIYKNIYCSLCSSGHPRELNLLAHKLIDTTDFHDPISQPFALLITALDHNYVYRNQFACDYTYKSNNLSCIVDNMNV